MRPYKVYQEVAWRGPGQDRTDVVMVEDGSAQLPALDCENARRRWRGLPSRRRST